MLHAFGDVSKPLDSTALLLEHIVYQQMVNLIVQSSNVAIMRCSTSIGIEEIIYLLHKNKAKLIRLINHLKFKDMKSVITKDIGIDDGTGEKGVSFDPKES